MYKKIKPKYSVGGYVKENGDALGMAAQTIGSVIPDDGGFGSIAGGGLKMAGQGAAIGTAIAPGIGTLVGAGIGLVGGVVGGIFGNKKKKEAEKKAQANYIAQTQAAGKQFTENQSIINTAGYDFNGVTDQYFEDGGIPGAEYEAEKGEVVQGQPLLEESTVLSNDMFLVGGKKHSEGGTDGIGGERIFSDKNRLSKEAQKAFENLNIKFKKRPTYAEAATKIGRNKGKAEDKIESKMAPSVATGKRMLEDQENGLDVLFTLQEINKPMKRNIKKYAEGGILPKNNPYTQPLVPAPTGLTNLVNTSPYRPVASVAPVNDGGLLGKVTSAINNNSGQLINAASYMTNKNAIDKLETTIPRSYIQAPNYSYVNRSQQAKNDNMNAYRATVAGLSTSSRGVNASNAGALYAATLNEGSRINNAENLRRDQYDERFSQRADRVNYANTMIDNEAQEKELQMRNEKNVALPLSARNAFLQGYAGNTAMSQRNNLDKQKMILSSFLNDSTGVLSRLDAEKVKNMKNLPIFKMFNN